MQPWPIAFTHLVTQSGKPPLRVAIKEVRLTGTPVAERRPGELRTDRALRVACGDQWIEVCRLQPAGKREMTGEAFARGHASGQPPAAFA
jgi:methionyl-tRNA formyltransferase